MRPRFFRPPWWAVGKRRVLRILSIAEVSQNDFRVGVSIDGQLEGWYVDRHIVNTPATFAAYARSIHGDALTIHPAPRDWNKYLARMLAESR